MAIFTVLVTGGAGYIGAHVVDALISQGSRVVVVDNLVNGRKQHVHPKATFIKSSILNTRSLTQIFNHHKPDAVVHLAALKSVNDSMQDAISYSNTNIVGTINLLNTMITHKVKHIVFSSSAATYGDPLYLPIDEEHIQKPISYYGETKLIIEQLLRWYSSIHDMNYISLRYFNAAGHTPSLRVVVLEPHPQNLIPIILEVAIGVKKVFKINGNNYPTPDGTCVRDYIHVCDLADAHVLALQRLVSVDESLELNLGTGRGHSVHEVYTTACEVVKKTIPMEYTDRRPGDMPELYAKSVLAQKKLNWKPQYTDIRTIIEHAWEAFRLYYHR